MKMQFVHSILIIISFMINIIFIIITITTMVSYNHQHHL